MVSILTCCSCIILSFLRHSLRHSIRSSSVAIKTLRVVMSLSPLAWVRSIPESSFPCSSSTSRELASLDLSLSGSMIAESSQRLNLFGFSFSGSMVVATSAIAIVEFLGPSSIVLRLESSRALADDTNDASRSAEGSTNISSSSRPLTALNNMFAAASMSFSTISAISRESWDLSNSSLIPALSLLISSINLDRSARYSDRRFDVKM